MVRTCVSGWTWSSGSQDDSPRPRHLSATSPTGPAWTPPSPTGVLRTLAKDDLVVKTSGRYTLGPRTLLLGNR
jgi:hypothetical protein